MSQRSKKIIAVVALVALAVGGYYFFARSGGWELSGKYAGVRGGGESPVRVPPAGQKLYHDNDFYFSFFYPQELSINETHNGTGTTLVFQSINPAEGFQIYIIPYREQQITEQRFKMDEPSGVRTNVTNGLVAGAQAVAFYSTSAALGDTYEVWFIHNGFLYEVTTLKALDTWLQAIMITWEFDS